MIIKPPTSGIRLGYTGVSRWSVGKMLCLKLLPYDPYDV